MVRYLGAGAGPGAPQLAFQQRTVAYGRAEYAGPLAWAGSGGGVSAWFAAVIEQARRGHQGRVQVPLRPQEYQQLTPGRRALIAGAEWSVEALSDYSPVDEAGATQLDLISRL